MTPTPQQHRWAVAAAFAVQGLCFATWASRIPAVQHQLGLSAAALGGVLLALPVGSVGTLPLAGWLVSRFGSRRVVVLGMGLYALVLPLLGLAATVPQLLAALVLFGMAGELSNIGINTQAVGVEALYGRSIMATFHGLWSLAGFAGAGLGVLLVGQHVGPLYHFLGVGALLLPALLLLAPRLLPTDAPRPAGTPLLALPDRSLLLLGVLAFCSLLCEGTMFDWSGVYFRQVVRAPEAWVGLGFAAFMALMATGRFVADWFTDRYGRRRTLVLSGLLEAGGLLLAVAFPTLWAATLGFMLVGLGTAAVVPLVYGAAGRSTTMPAGMALAAVTTVGFVGFLLGPPLIGFVAAVSSLRVSFALIAAMGLAVAALGRRVV
ncbi:MFS transporter [Hymenobacter actinosclerus]|uniref:Predicted arabinose efflux permease, MFS family n=1 Tax=Hymenobacter actinosclerus TaxID=82805 RepID=A0A1I0ETX9_9BACT|nr:MFS transporter [Hymenobacter actinosclerus]SET48993.1 Predicted arabinose efflux permease, MFS family [Hymenobacter actinosclerus]